VSNGWAVLLLRMPVRTGPVSVLRLPWQVASSGGQGVGDATRRP